jgi:hypothetical protein
MRRLSILAAQIGQHNRAIEGWFGKRSFMKTIRILIAFLALAIPAVLFGQIGIRVSIGPPALPMVEQPICPGDGYLWTPGYWAYDDSVSDYYWVDGAWILAPEEGLLWTPGYWGWGDGGFFFNEGYWGPTVGFYGGINYGFGYWGGGYGGGRWDGGHFFYNRSVNSVDITINRNVYNENIEHGGSSNRVSFNGGKGGVEARPNVQQETAARERHIPAVAAQTSHAQTARANPASRASVNHGQPSTAEKALPIGSNDRQAAAPQQTTAPRAAVHPADLPPIARPAAVNSGNSKADQRYEAKQDKLIATQNQERQQLQQKQDAEHQRTTNANTPKLEQKHQQQTQQLAQKHTAQQQALQSRQPQPRSSGGGGRR